MINTAVKLVGALTILSALDVYLDNRMPLYSSSKPHGECNEFKTMFWGNGWCYEKPSELKLPRPVDLNSVPALKNLSTAIVEVDQELRHHSLKLRLAGRMLDDDEQMLKTMVEKGSKDLGEFRLAFDAVYDTIVFSVDKISTEIKSADHALKNLQIAFDAMEKGAWNYHLAHFEASINAILTAVQPIPDLLSKTRKEAGYEQRKLIDIVAGAERQKENYWFYNLRTTLGFLHALNGVVKNAEDSIATLKYAEDRIRNSYYRWKNTRDELRVLFNINGHDYFDRLSKYPELRDSFKNELESFSTHVRAELDFIQST